MCREKFCNGINHRFKSDRFGGPNVYLGVVLEKQVSTWTFATLKPVPLLQTHGLDDHVFLPACNLLVKHFKTMQRSKALKTSHVMLSGLWIWKQ